MYCKTVLFKSWHDNNEKSTQYSQMFSTPCRRVTSFGLAIFESLWLYINTYFQGLCINSMWKHLFCTANLIWLPKLLSLFTWYYMPSYMPSLSYYYLYYSMTKLSFLFALSSFTAKHVYDKRVLLYLLMSNACRVRPL